MATYSLRLRLLAWIALLLVGILTGFGVTAYQLNVREQREQLDAELARRLSALTVEVRGAAPNFGGPPPSFGNNPGGPRGFGNGQPPGNGPGDGNREPRDHGPPPELSDGPGRGERPEPRNLPGFRPDGGGRRGGFPDRERKITLSADTAGLFASTEPHAPYFQIWTREGSVMAQSANLPDGFVAPDNDQPSTTAQTRNRGGYRELYYFTERADGILVGLSLDDYTASTRRLFWLLAAAGGVVLAIGLGGGWWVVTRATRPVQEIATAAARIAEGNLAERIDDRHMASELARLAGVLNSTFSRLESSFTEQKRFTADASHELRTPLAVMISEAQTTLARERTPADYRAALEGCLDSAQQMRRLTDSLLQFARFDAGQEVLQLDHVDLAELTRQCLARVRPLAEPRGITLQTHLSPAPLVADGARLAQIITNLLQNALQYNVDQGQVRVVTRVVGDRVELSVTDTGTGIEAKDLPHLFERFYRADRARSRGEGHSGLGLAIAQTIAQAHGGKITVESQPGAGATFTLNLPQSRAA